jgi:hypothetical protein
VALVIPTRVGNPADQAGCYFFYPLHLSGLGTGILVLKMAALATVAIPTKKRRMSLFLRPPTHLLQAGGRAVSHDSGFLAWPGFSYALSFPPMGAWTRIVCPAPTLGRPWSSAWWVLPTNLDLTPDVAVRTAGGCSHESTTGRYPGSFVFPPVLVNSYYPPLRRTY